MAISGHVEGLDTVLKNLNKEISKLKGNVQKGLTLAMTFIKGQSMDKTPVDVGNLRASHYLVTGDGHVSDEAKGFKTKYPKKSGKKITASQVASAAKVASEHQSHVSEAKANATSKRAPFAEIGCTAFYAVYVHEDLEARHITGGAKFLERSIHENQGKILDTVKRFAKL
jgi:hypothetical protein